MTVGEIIGEPLRTFQPELSDDRGASAKVQAMMAQGRAAAAARSTAIPMNSPAGSASASASRGR